MKISPYIRAALTALGLTTGIIVLFLVLSVGTVMMFFMQSDEAWSAVTLYNIIFMMFAALIGMVIFIIKIIKINIRDQSKHNETLHTKAE